MIIDYQEADEADIVKSETTSDRRTKGRGKEEGI